MKEEMNIKTRAILRMILLDETLELIYQDWLCEEEAEQTTPDVVIQKLRHAIEERFGLPALDAVGNEPPAQFIRAALNEVDWNQVIEGLQESNGRG